ALYVETACGNVGSDQDVETTFAQLVDSSFTQLLRHVAVEWRCGKTAGGKFVGEVDRQRLRAYEDDHAVERFSFENAGERVELVGTAHWPVALANGFRGYGFHFDGDVLRVTQVMRGDLADRRRHGG